MPVFATAGATRRSSTPAATIRIKTRYTDYASLADPGVDAVHIHSRLRIMRRSRSPR
jgi:hypothetical protein